MDIINIAKLTWVGFRYLGCDSVRAAPPTPVEVHGLLSVDGVHLVDRLGHPVQLRGMSSHGLQWGRSSDNRLLESSTW